MVISDFDYERLINKLGILLGRDIDSTREIHSCPNCEGKCIIKYGNYKNGQRYMCKNCGKTFSKRTNTLWYYSKKNPSLWAKFIELMIKIEPLRNISEKLKIDLTTAFYWRHKVLYALTESVEPEILEDAVEMCKLLVHENFKGDKKAKYKERKTLWIIAATDSKDKILAKPISKELWSKSNFDKKVYSKVDNKSFLYTYGDRYLKNIENFHNIGKSKENYIKKDLLNKYMETFLETLLKFRGIATKYLRHYMYWISIFSVDKKYDALSLLYKIVYENFYIKGGELKSIATI